jgi:hypothetical protein
VRDFDHFFESVSLVLHWSDANDNTENNGSFGPSSRHEEYLLIARAPTPTHSDAHICTPQTSTKNPSPTRYQGAYVPYDIRTEVIHIAGRAEALSWRVRASVFGPVITDVSIDNYAPKSGHPLSLRWVTILILSFFFFRFPLSISNLSKDSKVRIGSHAE